MLHQQSSHRQQHSYSSRAARPYLLIFSLAPYLLLHLTHNAEAGAIAICLACISSLHHLAGLLSVLPQEAPLSRVIALVGSAALPSLLLGVRARWRPSFHSTDRLCSCDKTDPRAVLARAKQKPTQLWNRHITLHRPGTTRLGPTFHQRLPACTDPRTHSVSKETILRGAPCVPTTTRPRDLQPTHHGARAQTEPR